MSSGQSTDIRSRLPVWLRPLFWDHDFRRLTWDHDRDLVIGRVLGVGDWQAVCWLRDPDLRAWLERHEGGSLSPRQLRFWELVLQLPRRRVNGWLRETTRATWDRRRV